jgi:hypothetical protein
MCALCTLPITVTCRTRRHFCHSIWRFKFSEVDRSSSFVQFAHVRGSVLDSDWIHLCQQKDCQKLRHIHFSTYRQPRTFHPRASQGQRRTSASDFLYIRVCFGFHITRRLLSREIEQAKPGTSRQTPHMHPTYWGAWRFLLHINLRAERIRGCESPLVARSQCIGTAATPQTTIIRVYCMRTGLNKTVNRLSKRSLIWSGNSRDGVLAAGWKVYRGIEPQECNVISLSRKVLPSIAYLTYM